MKTQPCLKKQIHAKETPRYSYLTSHAEIRKEERFKISSEELCEQIDAQLFVHLGREKAGPIVYRLIYSRDDARWIVVVQDRYDKGIITVLPTEYYVGKYRKLKPEERRNAKRMVHWGRIESFLDSVRPHTTVAQESTFNLSIAA
mgnify:CR=1 FL=1